MVHTNNPEDAFYNDLPAYEQKHWVSKLRGHAKATKYDKTRGAAYLDIPSWYLQCEDDHAIPIFVQESMVKGARDGGANMKTERLKSGHSPFLSKPNETVDFILKAVTT